MLFVFFKASKDCRQVRSSSCLMDHPLEVLIDLHTWVYAIYRHFNWMAQHGVDGAFLQRFAGQCDTRADNSGIRRIRDEVGDRVQEAAEKNGRAFAIM